MRASLAVLVGAFSVALALAAAYWVYAGTWALAAVAHGLSAVLAGAAAVGGPDAGYQRRATSAALLAGGMALFLPLLGVLLMAVLAVMLHFPRRRRPQVWRRTPIPGLPVQPVMVSGRPAYGEGGLMDVLRHAERDEKRMNAIMAVRQLPRREAVPILKLALKDRSDDVRLFAYAMLDRFESEINGDINAQRQRLKGLGRHLRVHARLAALYWELAYLGLAQGGVRAHVLEQARDHADRALAAGDDAAVRFLLGRVLLELGDLDGAELAMRNAVYAGLDPGEVAPYRAEVAFLQRRFADVPRVLGQVPDGGRREPLLAQVVTLWCGGTS
ncbi:HEAT repeat domain-containing protein [Ectothiorhodospiraceae bacterium WFHF3C12]|nr:HEAT repeat domain-containing protein [Ectothiorhodospiraceae bacterium WFHF3C12]